MSTIQENLQTIADSTSAIKQAIIDKGGTVGDITTWAEAISGLSGSGSGHSEFLICLIDVGLDNYRLAVFDGVLEGDTWQSHMNQADISNNWELSNNTMPNGRLLITLSGLNRDYSSTSFMCDDIDDLNTFIDTSVIYYFES